MSMRKWDSIHSRINLLLHLLGLVSLLLLLKMVLTLNKQEKLILTESNKQFTNEVTSLLDNKTEVLRQVANDYTFWNDFVDHVKEPSRQWFLDNITTLIKSYKVDWVAVYGADFKLLHEDSRSMTDVHPYITDEILKSLHQKRFRNFFLRTPIGLIEIASA
ncbi:MAG: hypothetical protein LWW85_08980, partial [Marinilabiliales bacterium]|nr:hypothetical protein [Marinilabiliales bacterium]